VEKPLYYEDRRTGRIYSLMELAELIWQGQVHRYEVPRRFRLLATEYCMLLREAEEIAEIAAKHPKVDPP
jgi:hypothetical protein